MDCTVIATLMNTFGLECLFFGTFLKTLKGSIIDSNEGHDYRTCSFAQANNCLYAILLHKQQQQKHVMHARCAPPHSHEYTNMQRLWCCCISVPFLLKNETQMDSVVLLTTRL